MADSNYHLDQEIRKDNQRCAGIVLRGQSILLMHRKKEGREFYVLPGGHMQKNETREEALERELFEEASIKIKNIKLAFEFRDHIKNNFDYYYLCEIESGEVELGGEEAQKNSPENFYALEWVDLKETADLNLLPKAAKEWIQETLVDHNSI